MLKNFEFILASSSPRRIKLLKDLNLKFKSIKPNIEELDSLAYSPSEISIMNSYKKAYSVAKNYRDTLVTGFDTIIEISGKIIGKPKDKKDAYNILKLLSGKEHHVITGFTILNLYKEIVIKKYVKTKVFFKKLDDSEINWYISTGEPFDKAGAYAIQGKGAFIVKKIEGSYTNVVGLPLTEFLEELKRLK